MICLPTYIQIGRPTCANVGNIQAGSHNRLLILYEYTDWIITLVGVCSTIGVGRQEILPRNYLFLVVLYTVYF